MSHTLPIDTTVFIGDTPSDITSDVMSVSVRRGKSRWLDDVQAGTCSFTVDNRDRDYDPTIANAYSSLIVPQTKVTIKTGATEVFVGLIDDWNLDYTIDGMATASAVASDALSTLGRAKIDELTTTSQLAGVRLEAILDLPEVDFPSGDRDIDNGVTTLQADTIQGGTDVVTYAKLVERTEGGRLFVSADGKLTFQNRRTPVTSTVAATFDDTGSNIPYSAIGVQVGSELLYNRATVTRLGGAVQDADNSSSQTSYGVRALDYSGLLFTTDSESQTFASFLVAKYGDPKVRIDTLEINLSRLSVAQANTVVGLELGDLVRIVYTPPGGGAAIDQNGILEGIEHQIGIDQHRVRLSFSSALETTVFVLNDVVFGVLDSVYTLAY